MTEPRSTDGPVPRRVAAIVLLWGAILYVLFALDFVRYSRATAGVRRALAPHCPWIEPDQRAGR